MKRDPQAQREVERQGEQPAQTAPVRVARRSPTRMLQRAAGNAAVANLAMHSGMAETKLLARLQSNDGGDRLPSDLQRGLEGGFQQGLGEVRLHHDENAAELARALHASAFTYGSHIYFGAARYRPDTEAGRTLLAHELTHVVQQQRRPVPSGRLLSAAHDPAEAEAAAVAGRMRAGVPPEAIRAGPAAVIHRQEEAAKSRRNSQPGPCLDPRAHLLGVRYQNTKYVFLGGIPRAVAHGHRYVRLRFHRLCCETTGGKWKPRRIPAPWQGPQACCRQADRGGSKNPPVSLRYRNHFCARREFRPAKAKCQRCIRTRGPDKLSC